MRRINFNQQDIYKKQGHNFDIITYQPKQHDEYIKKYPKLSLEEKDQYFRFKYKNKEEFKKELISNQINQNEYNTNINNNHMENKIDIAEEQI